MSASARNGVDQTTTDSGWRSFLISLGFWGGLGGAAFLTAVLVLAPRLVQNASLQQRLLKNAEALAQLQQETGHLSIVAQALRNDPDYVARVAASELNLLPPGAVRIAVNPELEISSRVSAAVESPLEKSWSTPAFWSLPVLESLSTPGMIRQSCTFAAGFLFLLSFCCLNEDFVFSRFSLPQVCLPRRYRSISSASASSARVSNASAESSSDPRRSS